MGQVMLVDIGRAVQRWLNADATLVGRTRPVSNGFHLGRARSPGQGTIGEIEVGTRRPADWADRARVGIVVKAVGRAGVESKGPGWAAERGARAMAAKVLALTGDGAIVDLGDGTFVRLLMFDQDTAAGPVQVGDLGGEASWRLDVDVVAQPA